jgi:hypothetical protein
VSDLWRTRIDAADEARYGITEAHGVFFQPINDRGGHSNVVTVMIPETSDIEITEALAIAIRINARVAFLCDTRDQAEAIAVRATNVLSTHKRISYEQAEAGAWIDFTAGDEL